MTHNIKNKIIAIKRKISKKFEKDGCLIENAHFENGRNLHSNQYYFAKNYFQNNENCKELAEVLCAKLNKLPFPDETTLIGFRNYSGLLLKETTRQLGKFNYALIEENKDGFFWRHLPSLKQNLVIILPIACTGITYIRLRKHLIEYCSKEELKEKEIKVNENFIVVISILDESVNKEILPINLYELNSASNIRRIYSAFNWTEITDEQIVFNTPKEDKNDEKTGVIFRANSLIRLFSNMQLPEECNLCFPPNKITDEKPLFPTHDNYENPNLIFRFPNFSDTPKQKTFLNTFCSDENSCDVILSGNIDVNKTSFSSFIRGNTFYKKNKTEILEFFKKELAKHITDKDKNIIFITSENNHSSYFLEDLALSDLFKAKNKNDKDKKVTILRFQPSSEFVDNFVSLYSESFTDKKDPPKIIYFEDVLSAAKTFKLISNYIKHAKIDKTPKEKIKNELEIHGFDLVLTLIDRTPAYTRSEILKKLYSEKNRNPEENFKSFFRLNVPIIAATHLENPLERRAKNLKKLLTQCHLDSLKATVGEEIRKRLPIRLPELGSENEIVRRLDYFPFGVIERKIQKDLFELYKPYFNRNRLDLLALYLSHKINSELFDFDYIEEKYQEKPEQFIDDLINKIEIAIQGKIDEYFIKTDSPNLELRNFEIEKEIVIDRIVKNLSTPPFIYYKNIYESIFHYCIRELDKICSQIELDGEIKSFRIFRRLKFFIRRSIELNSNFIVSTRFLTLLKVQYTKNRFDDVLKAYKQTENNLVDLKNKGKIDEDYYNCASASLKYKREEVVSFFSYLLFCYKQLMSNKPSVSIKLEELINHHDLLPTEMEIYDNPNSNLKNLISDPYLHFTGMIKAENLSILNELKELHKIKSIELDELKLNGLKELHKIKSIELDELREREDSKLDELELEKLNKLEKEEKSLKEQIYNMTYFLNFRGIRGYYFRPLRNSPVILSVNKLLSKSRHFPKTDDFNKRLKTINFSNIRTAISKMLMTINLLENKRTKKVVDEKDKRANHNKLLNEEVKGILNSVMDIINPGINKESLKYAFFVETRKRIDDTDTSHIYSITSDEDSENPSDIRLNENGLIYNLLYGLYDSETKNIQTLLAGAKMADGKVLTFKDNYYVTKFGDDFKTAEVKKEFIDLYEEDRKGIIFYDKQGKAVKTLDEANMFLALRFANLQEPQNTSDKYTFEGRAVLLIMNSEKATTNNFLNFMSNEKVRLLLLIKEELLEYLQKQFDNDAFGEIVKNKQNALFEKSLRHGLLENLQRLVDINFEVTDNYYSSSNSTGISINPELFQVVSDAMRGQLRNFKYNLTEIETYSKSDILRKILMIFTSILFSKSIEPRFLNTDNFPDVQITANPVVLKVVIPEIIINMKKNSFKTKEYLVSYNEKAKTFIFENFIKPVDYTSSIGHKGGINMCKDIMEKLNGSFENKIIETEMGDKFRVILKLPN